jgi:carboxymethylenebutenolidase
VDVVPDVEYPSADGPMPGYLAVPSGEGPWPGVVVVHDAMGMTTDLRRITVRFAAHGYLALAPALYRRGRRIACVVSTFRSLTSGAGGGIDAIVAARDHLSADTRCAGRIGSVGFCMGGGFCLQLAPLGLFDAAPPITGPGHPSWLRCPIPVPWSPATGARDRLLRGAAARLESELGAGVVDRDIKEYPDVGHGFMNQFGTPRALQFVERIAGLAYSEPEAEDALTRILAFFHRHLAGPPVGS